MERKTTFYPTGAFYKGNLHLHSTVSDGKLPVSALKDAYKERGYQFIVYSEHNIYSSYADINESDFIVVPGFEAEFRKEPEDWRVYHLIMLPGPAALRAQAKEPFLEHMEEIPIRQLEDIASVQKLIDDMRARGYMVMINHPYWSTIEYDEILPLTGLFAVEVYNHCSEVVENMGRSDACWDALLRRDMRIWGTATDDNHNEAPFDHPNNDSFGGWVCVKANSLSEQDICEALHDGSFYSSQGPEIYDFYLEGNKATVKCSPVNGIYFRGDNRQVGIKIAPEGENSLTTLEYTLKGTETYIRVDCIDAKGKRAWSNPIFVK